MYIPDKNLLKSNVYFREFCRNIYGVGKSRTFVLLKNYGLYGCIKMSKVTKFFHKKLINFIDTYYITEKSLCNIVFNSLKNEQDLLTVRGWKLKYNLPLNGQRTHTNGCTASKLGFHYYTTTRRERGKSKSIKLNFYGIKDSKNRRKALRVHFRKFKTKGNKN